MMKLTLQNILLLTVLIVAFYSIGVSQVAVIASKDVPGSSITLDKLKELYNLHSNEISGSKIKLLDLAPECTAKEKFFDAIGKSQTELRKIWLKAKLTGNGSVPEVAQSEEDMIKRITSASATIGFVSTEKLQPGIKVLLKIE
jgi:hypothetical protein